MTIGDAIKSAIHGMPALVTGGQPGYRAGEDKLACAHEFLSGLDTFTVRSDAFEEGGAIPGKYSADGDGISPPISWRGLPHETRSVALVVEDPDAPTPEPFVHWLVYNIASSSTTLPEGMRPENFAATGAMQGKNSNLRSGWTGMAPPKGDTPHRYFFQVFALDVNLQLDEGAGRTALFEAMAGHVIASGRTIGTFHR